MGVASAAGAIITRAPREVRGVLSETMGDYTYNRGVGRAIEDSPFFSTAKTILRSVKRPGGVPFVP